MAELLISATEAMQILDIGRSTLHWLITEGRLRAYVPPFEGKRPRRIWLDRGQVETLAGSEWRERRKRGT